MKTNLITVLLFSVVISRGQTTNTFPVNGNVGIGITTPVQKLDIVGNMLLRNYTNVQGAGTSILFSSFGDSPGAKIRSFMDYANGANSSSRLILSSYSDAYNDELTLAGGNVGIGTSLPQGKLDIFCATNAMTNPLLSIRSNFNVVGNYAMIRFGDCTQTLAYQKGAIIYESVSGSARGRFHIALENTDGNGSVSLADSRFTVLSDGNVGIGTTSPAEKLSVNGKIRAKEIKVEITPWPDFVFLPSYKVPTLQEIEKHIKEKGHLPNIPTASEVKANGIDLGEMNAKLLQKIEELTLHLIEMKKEIGQQQLEIETLKLKIK